MSFTFPVVMTLGSIVMGLGIGASSIISRAIGEGDRDQVQRLTTDSLTLSLLIVGIFVFFGLMTIDPLPKFKIVLTSWQKILQIGLPAAATSMITPISIGLITSAIAFYGAEAVAAFGIASRIESLSLIVVLASLFNSDSQVVQIATKYLWLVPISYAGAGIIFVASSTFNALGKPIPSMIMTLSRMVGLYIPLAYLGSKLFGINGIFAAACIANLTVGIGAYIGNQKTCNLRTT